MRHKSGTGFLRAALIGALLHAALALVAGEAAAADKIHLGKAQGAAWTFLPANIGVEEGIFAKYGFDVDVIDLTGDAKVQQAFAANSIEFGLGSGPGMAFAVKGSPAIAVASYAGEPRNISAIVLAQSPIKTVADLKGKLVSVSTAGSLTDWLAKQMARQEGWGQDGVTTVALGAIDAAIAALKARQVDAVILSTEAGYQLEERGEGRIVVGMDRYAPHFITHVVFAQKQIVQNDPALVERFLKGFFASIAFMRANKEATSTIAERLFHQSPSVARKSYDYEISMLQSDGHFDAQAVETLKQSFVDMGTLDHKPANDELFTTRFVPVKPSGEAPMPVQTPWAKYPQWVNPVTTRSRIVLEIASELVSLPGSGMALRQAKVLLRDQGQSDWPLCLFGSSTIEGVRAVVNREAGLAIVNPAIMLTLAYRGTSVFKSPQPVRALTVIPSFDQYAFAVKSETGLATFEEIAEKRYPLRVSLRGMPDHSLHFMLDDILAAAGFSLEDLRAWGGEARKDGFLPVPGGPKFQALARGEINAIFDEAADVWVEQALDAGMTILPLGETTVRKLEAIGYRRGYLPRSMYAKLPADILTIDFSGWPIFVHAEAPDELVAQFCAALEARKDSIPWQGDGPLPLDRMCRDTPETPQDVPFHPAAERFWKERGYLP